MAETAFQTRLGRPLQVKSCRRCKRLALHYTTSSRPCVPCHTALVRDRRAQAGNPVRLSRTCVACEQTYPLNVLHFAFDPDDPERSSSLCVSCSTDDTLTDLATRLKRVEHTADRTHRTVVIQTPPRPGFLSRFLQRLGGLR